MKKKRVSEIVIPLKGKNPRLHPNVQLEDDVAYVLEVMTDNELEEVTVMSINRPIGLVRMDDILNLLGLTV